MYLHVPNRVYLYSKVVQEKNRQFFHWAHSSVKEGAQGGWRRPQQMRSGTGANKTASEDSPSSEVKAAGAANLIPLQGGCRSNHLPDGYQWCCSMPLCLFNESSCPWNGSQPKMEKGRLRVGVSLFILALVLVKASWLSSKGVSFHILCQILSCLLELKAPILPSLYCCRRQGWKDTLGSSCSKACRNQEDLGNKKTKFETILS